MQHSVTDRERRTATIHNPPSTNRALYGDIIGGITTFFTMAYIVVVNPGILASPGTGMAFSGVLTATVLLAFAMTLMMGLYARLPFAVAPGMGLNAFFAFTIVLQQQVPWPTALGIVFWAGRALSDRVRHAAARSRSRSRSRRAFDWRLRLASVCCSR